MPALTPGQLAKADQQGRVTIPLDVLKGVGWWTGARVRVTGELTRRGLLRVYTDSVVNSTISSNDDGNITSAAGYIAQAVLADRYRALALYGDGRLRLTKEVCAWLGFSLGEKRDLYCQSSQYFLEVMSMEHRFQRLDDAQDDVLPWPSE
jgi:hypothetical protein